MGARKRVVLFGFLLLILFFGGTLSVHAAEPANPTMFEIRLDVQKDGSWSIPSFGGLDLGLNSQTFQALSGLLGLQVQAPTVDTALVDMAMTNGIQNLALVKEGSQTTILLNNQPITAVALSGQAEEMVSSLAPDLEAMIAGLNRSHIAVGVHFPAASGPDQALDLSVRLPSAAAEAAPLNAVDVGLTVSEEGKLVSVGGVRPEQLGLAPITLDTSILKQYGVTSVGASLGAGSLEISANGEPLAAVMWSPDMLSQAPDLYTSATGQELAPSARQSLALASSWLRDTRLTVNAAVADTPQEDTPRISLGRPINITVAKDNTLLVEGMPVSTGMERAIAEYTKKVNSLALTWSGADGELRPVANGRAMPILAVEREFVTAALASVLGSVVDWDMVADTMMNIDFTVTAVAEGGVTPDLTLLQGEPLPRNAIVSLVPKVKVSRTDGSVALYNELLPLDVVESIAGLSITEPVRQTAEAYGGIKTAGITVGPSGIRLTLNGKNAYLLWDSTLRQNLVALATEWYYGPATSSVRAVSTTSGLAGFFQDFRIGIIQGLLGLLDQVEIGVEVQVQDEPLPAGTLSNLVQSVANFAMP